jgi:hypothetical protein
MGAVVDKQDRKIGMIAEGAYEHQRTTRGQAVINCRTWALAFSNEGKAFAQSHGWKGGHLLCFVDWLAANYPLQYKCDPIPAWGRSYGMLILSTLPHA